MCGEPATQYINWIFTESAEDDRQFHFCDKHHTNSLKAYKEIQEEKEDEDEK